MRNFYINKKGKTGFTLIELIAVIAVIAILALAIIPNVIKYRKKAVASDAVSDAKTIVDEYHVYCLDNNKDYNDTAEQAKKFSVIYSDISNSLSVPKEFDYNVNTNSDFTLAELEKIKNGEWQLDTDFIVNINGTIQKK